MDKLRDHNRERLRVSLNGTNQHRRGIKYVKVLFKEEHLKKLKRDFNITQSDFFRYVHISKTHVSLTAQ